MPSSLLLDNFVIQKQPTQYRNEVPPTAPITFQFYQQHEQQIIEETTSVPLPTASNRSKLKNCTCCPYGFHIDLDFIRYCEELAANGKRPSSKQIDRRNKRRQRKSLEVMLGFDDQWLLDYEKSAHPFKQQKSQFQTVYEVSVNLVKGNYTICFTDNRLFVTLTLFANQTRLNGGQNMESAAFSFLGL